MNSAVWPIFNENFVEKRGLWVSWTVHGTHMQNARQLLLSKRALKPELFGAKKTTTVGLARFCFLMSETLTSTS